MSDKVYCSGCWFCEEGLCHRLPPVTVPYGEDAVTGYPEVDDDDWCGMGKPKEEFEVKDKYDAAEDRKAKMRERYEQAFENLKASFSPGEPVTVKELSDRLNVTEKAVRVWIKNNWQDTYLRFKNGVVFVTKDGNELS